jgi:chromatin segregation and condensation protein Rec8/ScpA/Scc1 (kleisin family)
MAITNILIETYCEVQKKKKLDISEVPSVNVIYRYWNYKDPNTYRRMQKLQITQL